MGTASARSWSPRRSLPPCWPSRSSPAACAVSGRRRERPSSPRRLSLPGTTVPVVTVQPSSVMTGPFAYDNGVLTGRPPGEDTA